MKDARFQHKTVIKAMCDAIANVQNLKSKALSKPNSTYTLQSGHTCWSTTGRHGRHLVAFFETKERSERFCIKMSMS